MLTIIRQGDTLLSTLGRSIPEWLISLATRILVFHIFWWAVQTKIHGLTVAGQHFAFWNLNDSTFLLFEHEYAVPLLPPDIAAYLGTFGEFFLSLMILFGFFTRFAALGLLAMTLVIQFFVYPSGWWNAHAFWVVILVYLLRYGGGRISLDYLFISKR